jgi:hypothetical protein
MYAESHSRGQKCNGRARPLNDGNVFSLTGVPIAKDAVLVEAGLDWRLTPAIRFGVEYQGELAATRANPHRQGQLHLGFLTAPPAWSALTPVAKTEIQAIYRGEFDPNCDARPCADERKAAGARTGETGGKQVE